MMLERLKELAGKATPGPWYERGIYWLLRYARKSSYETDWDEAGPEDNMPEEDDACFIVALRNKAEALLEVAEAARVLCNNVNDDTGEYEECWQKLYAALAKLEVGK